MALARPENSESNVILDGKDNLTFPSVNVLCSQTEDIVIAFLATKTLSFGIIRHSGELGP